MRPGTSSQNAFSFLRPPLPLSFPWNGSSGFLYGPLPPVSRGSRAGISLASHSLLKGSPFPTLRSISFPLIPLFFPSIASYTTFSSSFRYLPASRPEGFGWASCCAAPTQPLSIRYPPHTRRDRGPPALAFLRGDLTLFPFLFLLV